MSRSQEGAASGEVSSLRSQGTGAGIAATQPVSAQELLTLADGRTRYELVRGEVRSLTPAGFRHGVVVQRLAQRMSLHVEAAGLGVVVAAETGFQIGHDPDTVRAPDIAFVARERMPAGGKLTGYYPGAPDLVVEVISLGDRYTDVSHKTSDWLSAGACQVWVVDPELCQVVAYRSPTDVQILTEKDTLRGGTTLPGFECPVAEIFRLA